MGFNAVDRDLHDSGDFLIGPLFSIKKMQSGSVVVMDGAQDIFDDLSSLSNLKASARVFFYGIIGDSLDDF